MYVFLFSSRMFRRFHLWAKLNGNQAVQVSTVGRSNIDGFKKNLKIELFPRLNSFSVDEITIQQTLSSEPLQPDCLLSTVKSGLSANEPLIVKVIEHQANPKPSKTIFIQDIDDECRPIDSFTEALIESDEDVKAIIGIKGEALVKLSQPKKRLTKYSKIEDGEKYRVFSSYLQSFSDEV